MVFIHVGTVVVLTTSKTTTTWVLSVLADTTVTGRDVTAAVEEELSVQEVSIHFHVAIEVPARAPGWRRRL